MINLPSWLTIPDKFAWVIVIVGGIYIIWRMKVEGYTKKIKNYLEKLGDSLED